MPKPIPLFVRATFLLVGLYVLIHMLYIGQEIILPLIYAGIITILLNPLVTFLIDKRISRILAVSLVLTISSLIISTIIVFISWKVSTLDSGLPELMAKFEILINQMVHWIAKTFHIREWKVNLWITDSRKDLMTESNTAIGLTLTAMSGLLATMILTPVYVFLMLLYKPHLDQFIHRLFAKTNIERLDNVVAEINDIIKKYLSGLFIQFSIVTLFDCAGLLLLGIEYPLVLGIIGGFLNLIPYLGGLVTMVLFAAIALVTKPPIYLLYVIILYGAIQFIDNNIIVPKILGSRVKLNALVSVFAVITGGMLWGIPGMFLSIPLVAILKLVFDLYEPLKPWGFLMGEPEEQEPPTPKQ
ncbi:MAG: AI-2E family transporter [Saprospiraceae bacterium]|nr:AI-2E family transporter [Saprospiraceae bacterium]